MSVKTSDKPKRGYHYDPSYGKWVKIPKAKRAKTGRKGAGKKAAATRKRNAFNKAFDYGASLLAAPAAPVISISKGYIPKSAKRFF